MIITPDIINEIFASSTDQHVVFIKLHSLLYEEDAWDQIDHLLDFPRCGAKLHYFLFTKFIDFDKVHHPEVMAGGLWMNAGWSEDKSLGSWEVVPAEYVLRGES